MRSEMKVNDLLKTVRLAIRNGSPILLAIPDTNVKCEICGSVSDAIDCLEIMQLEARLSCPSCQSPWGMIT